MFDSYSYFILGAIRKVCASLRSGFGVIQKYTNRVGAPAYMYIFKKYSETCLRRTTMGLKLLSALDSYLLYRGYLYQKDSIKTFLLSQDLDQKTYISGQKIMSASGS